jgi:FlaA1/EpsC-like NDP-sugar epimerase
VIRLELEQLIERPPLVGVRSRGRESVRDRVVLITGAGGSIGSVLSRHCLDCAARRLILLDNSEHNLNALLLDLTELPGADRVVVELDDGSDEGRLEATFDRLRPNVVLHAAAYKHAPLLEGQPLAAVRNNVLLTRRLLRTARQFGAERFVMISTDKAVDPVSLMGATKRLAELVLLAGEPSAPCATSVRLGNVWGSRGSVVPRFLDQLEASRPLTVTDRRATRFFLGAHEAAGLALSALELGAGRDILVPDLGPPLSILHIARRLLEAAGVDPDQDDRIRFTGLRPGDKLTERLVSEEERTVTSADPSISRVVAPLPVASDVERWLSGLEERVRGRDVTGLLQDIVAVLPGYRPGSTLRTAAVDGAARA